MRNVSLFLSFLIIFSTSFSQQKPFEQGFAKGFKEGYCYNQSITCLAPLTPLCPMPRINENENNFTDGYNRGFQTGLDLKRVEGGTNSSSINYSSIPNYRFNDYIPQIPITDYLNVLLYKRALMEKRLDWINKRIQDIGDLNYVLLFNIYNEAYNVRLSDLSNFVNSKLKINNPDLTDNFVFNQIVEIFSMMQKNIYENYTYAKKELEKIVINDDVSISDAKVKLFITYYSDNTYTVKGIRSGSTDTLANLQTEMFLLPLSKNSDKDDDKVFYIYLVEYECYFQVNYGFVKKNIGKRLSMDFLGSTNSLLVASNKEFVVFESGKVKEGVESMGERQFLTKRGNIINGPYYQVAKERKFFICPYHIEGTYLLAYPLYVVFR
jgi:hypothetical protein